MKDKNIYQNITSYQYKQLHGDNLPIRKNAPSYTQYYDKPQHNVKRCKICIYSWDNGKILSNMAHLHKAKKEVPIYYYIDIEREKVVKLREYLNTRKDNTPLDTRYVYYGTKTQAQKRLDKLVA